MHEISLAGSVINLIEAAAAREGFSRVRQVRCEIGELACVEADALLTEWFASEPQPDAAPEPDPGAEPDAEPVQPETTAAVDAPEDEGPTRTAEPEEDEPEEHQRPEGEDRA